MQKSVYSPIYCAMYPELSELFRKHGYALAVHGSMARDFDLIAVKWAETVSDHETVLQDMESTFIIRRIGEGPTIKNHFRLAYMLSIGYGSCSIDLSFV